MEKPELLMPAGNLEKIKYAVAFGADAVYLGTADFSLRSPKTGLIINDDNLKESVKTAQAMGAKAYVTLNVFANNEIIEKLPSLIDILQDAKPNAIIFADPGFFWPLKKNLPDIPLHVSTQANILNYESVKFWQDLGASRVILARELSLREIEKIHEKVPDMELEVLVHGSLCVSYSGRCLLSDYLTDNKRKANQGNCAQPCRWKYKLIEERRPHEEYEITEDHQGTYIMNPKDIALIEYIPDLINAGVSSFKVEGRTKSVYYVSTVAKTYRKAIDAFSEAKTPNIEELTKELFNAGNRGFTSGFFLDKPDKDHYDYILSKSKAQSVFKGMIKQKISENTYRILVKNQIKTGDDIEWITPSSHIKSKVEEIMDINQEIINTANTNAEIYIKLKEPLEDWEWGILRSREIKNESDTKAHLYSGACN